MANISPFLIACNVSKTDNSHFSYSIMWQVKLLEAKVTPSGLFYRSRDFQMSKESYDHNMKAVPVYYKNTRLGFVGF